MSLAATRRKRLGELIEKCGGLTPLAKKLGLSGPSYLSQLKGEVKPITEKTARKYEHILNLPSGWFDSADFAEQGDRSHYGPSHTVFQIGDLTPLQIATVDALVQLCRNGEITDSECAKLLAKWHRAKL